MTELFFVGSGGRRTDASGEQLRSSDARERLARAVQALQSIDEPVHRAYSSTHELDMRALLQAFDADVPSLADPRLDQIRIGAYASMPLSEVLTDELVYGIDAMGYDYRFPGGGETTGEVARRVANFVLDTGVQRPNERIAVVLPEFTLRAFAGRHLGMSAVFACREGVMFDPVTPVSIDNGKISVAMSR